MKPDDRKPQTASSDESAPGDNHLGDNNPGNINPGNLAPGEIDLEQLPLDQIATTSWQLLRDGVATNGAFRLPVLVTNTVDGADARVLVLRRADEASQVLEFHTDVRSAKVRQLRGSDEAVWVFYDHSRKLQIRARSVGTIGCDAVADARWSELNDHTKRAYAQTLAPGTAVDELRDAAPCSDVENVETGRSNFAVVVCKVSEIEWLLLSRAGHRRAVSRFIGTEWSTSWIMP